MPAHPCLGCGAKQLHPVLSLGEQPLANALTDEPAPEGEPRYPLDLVLCEVCSLVQLTESVPPSLLFTDYRYFSSFSPTLVDSADRLVDRLVSERALGPGDLALEIGSNDGYLLQHYQARGVSVLGVDPAENVAQSARERGVPTECAFFDPEVAQRLVAEHQRVAVLHANNVLAHVPDVNGVLTGIARMLHDDGVAVIETPYVRDLVEQLEFDTIYHEHLYYYSVTALENLLRRNGLRLHDVEHIPLHGGSLRAFVVRDDGGDPLPAVRRYLEDEQELGLPAPGYFQDFGRRVEALRADLRALLDDLHGQGATLAGYGAAAKATVLLNAIGAGPGTLAFVADQSPHKQGRFIPGVGIPIVGPEVLAERQPDYVLLLAWTFAEEILAQQQRYREAGGRFILPVPHPRIVGPGE
jgi:SAM-dependent methyltransferase